MDRLAIAPKSISKVPKMVNDHLLKAQKEILVAYKPLLELLAFYYSPEYETLKKFIPEVRHVFEQHKIYISQVLALLASAGIKVSRARKDNIRPIFAVPAVLRQEPTASDVLGTNDLASLSDKTTKEQAALRSKLTFFSFLLFSFEFTYLTYCLNESHQYFLCFISYVFLGVFRPAFSSRTRFKYNRGNQRFRHRFKP